MTTYLFSLTISLALDSLIFSHLAWKQSMSNTCSIPTLCRSRMWLDWLLLWKEFLASRLHLGLGLPYTKPEEQQVETSNALYLPAYWKQEFPGLHELPLTEELHPLGILQNSVVTSQVTSGHQPAATFSKDVNFSQTKYHHPRTLTAIQKFF